MGEAKNRKHEIEALKAKGKKVADLSTLFKSLRKVNGFTIGNPYDIMAKVSRNANTIKYDKPYGWQFDVGVSDCANRLNLVATSPLGDMFKRVVENFAKQFNAKYEFFVYECEDDRRYVRLEVFTSHEVITDMLQPYGHIFTNVVKKLAA